MIYTRITDLRQGDKNWEIRARVQSKGELKSFHSEQGVYFASILEDNSGQIRAAFFNAAARKANTELLEGQIYILSGGDIEPATRYNVTQHPYEILFKENSAFRIDLGGFKSLVTNEM